MKTPILITGYQWGQDFRYIGPYQFEKNMDREEVYLPSSMKMTLVEPPEIPSGQFAQWDVESKSWNLRDLPSVPAAAPVLPADQLMPPEEFAQREAAARADLIASAEVANGN